MWLFTKVPKAVVKVPIVRPIAIGSTQYTAGDVYAEAYINKLVKSHHKPSCRLDAIPIFKINVFGGQLK